MFTGFMVVMKFLVSIVASIFNGIGSLIGLANRNANERNRLRKNAENQGIVNYQPCEIECFFDPSKPLENVVISGGTPQMRAKTISAALNVASYNHCSAIILHESNKLLESDLKTNGSISATIVNENLPTFEPFLGLTDSEIGQIMIESATKDYNIGYNGKQYLEGMAMYLRANGFTPTLNMFAHCPHMDLFDKIDNLEQSGKISSQEASKIKSKLMMGQSENFKIESFLQDLYRQSERVLNKKNKASRPQSINDAINKNDILAVDITSNMNKLLLNVLVCQISLSMSKGKRLMLILDGISIADNELLAKLVKSNSDRCKTVISAADLYAHSGGDEHLFHTLVGNSDKTVIMSHSSGASATKWADTIGYYDMTEAQQQYQQGKMRQNAFQLFPGYNSSQSVTYNVKREHIVKPEVINRLAPNEVYIYSNADNELAHTTII